MAVSLSHWWWGVVSYAVAHLVHVLLWRLRPPGRDVRTLVEVFFLPLLPALPLALVSGVGLSPLFVHALLGAHYIAIYPAFQASSPTVHMLDLLYREKEGLPAEAISERLAFLHRQGERMEDLVVSRLVIEREGRLSLSRRGYYLARAFKAYRNLLGLPVGGG